MGTSTEPRSVTVKLTRDAATALVKEARERFENGAHELVCSNDEGQRPTIAACTEIIGRVGETIAPRRWPKDETPYGKEERALAEFAFSAETLDWIAWHRDEQAPYVNDFDTGFTGGADPGYHAEQVFILHVFSGILEQREQAAV